MLASLHALAEIVAVAPFEMLDSALDQFIDLDDVYRQMHVASPFRS